MSNKIIISALLISLSCNFSRASTDTFVGIAIGTVGTGFVWLISSLFGRKPLDQSGSIYRENMRPQKGKEYDCRALARALELLDYGLTLEDKQGQSEAKAELGKQKIDVLGEYRLNCNDTAYNSGKF